MRVTQILRSGGGKIPYANVPGCFCDLQWLTEASYSYPKHVWSPAGGWYSQPANWKTNTAIMGAVMAGIVTMVWSYSAENEFRNEMPRVRIPEQQGEMGGKLTLYSPTDFTLRDGGASRSLSTSGNRRRNFRKSHERRRGHWRFVVGTLGLRKSCVYIQDKTMHFLTFRNLGRSGALIAMSLHLYGISAGVQIRSEH